MKLSKTLLTGLLAVASAGSAFAAATDVYIAGATTFRGPVTAAIVQGGMLTSLTWAYDQSSGAPYKAGAAVFHGFLASTGSEVYIHTYWTGSLAGCLDVATKNPNVGGYIPDSVPMSISGTNVHGTYTAFSHAPDAALSDSQQGTIAQELATYDAATSSSVTGLIDAGVTASSAQTVGVAPFMWVLGNIGTNTAPFTSITQQQASAVLQGPTPLSMFTGGTADLLNYVVAVGRNEDSGTRINAFAEGQLGYAPATVAQYLPTFSNNQQNQSASGGNPLVPEGGITTSGTPTVVTSSTVSGLGAWPQDWALNTESTISWITAGHSGFNGGGDVANALAAVNPVTGLTFTASSLFNSGTLSGEVGSAGNNIAGQPGNAGFVNDGSSKIYLVGYLGIADAVGNGTTTTFGTSGAYGASPLNYNGIPYSISAVENGQYTFWTLEHCYYLSTISGPAKTAVDKIADLVYSTYAPTNSSGVLNQPNAAGILYTGMKYTRTQEGVTPAPNY